MPRVSIIMPTFNLDRFIGRALGSALAQTYRDYEIIVADDGSTDDTREVVARCGGKVQYFYQANRGVAAARNLAISKASGEFIAYLDADDLWYPHKLERQVAFLDAHPECALVHSDLTIIDEADRVVSLADWGERGRSPVGACGLLEMLQENAVQILTVVERRESLERVGPFDERLKGVDDYLRWILYAMEGLRFGYMDEPLVKYRKRAASFSRAQRLQWWAAFVKLFEILLYEKSLEARGGREAAGIVRARLYGFRRDLAYFERMEGRLGDSRKRLYGLIREWPWRSELYVDLLKACLPPTVTERLRRLKEPLRQAGRRNHGLS